MLNLLQIQNVHTYFYHCIYILINLLNYPEIPITNKVVDPTVLLVLCFNCVRILGYGCSPPLTLYSVFSRQLQSCCNRSGQLFYCAFLLIFFSYTCVYQLMLEALIKRIFYSLKLMFLFYFFSVNECTQEWSSGKLKIRDGC